MGDSWWGYIKKRNDEEKKRRNEIYVMSCGPYTRAPTRLNICFFYFYFYCFRSNTFATSPSIIVFFEMPFYTLEGCYFIFFSSSYSIFIPFTFTLLTLYIIDVFFINSIHLISFHLLYEKSNKSICHPFSFFFSCCWWCCCCCCCYLLS